MLEKHRENWVELKQQAMSLIGKPVTCYALVAVTEDMDNLYGADYGTDPLALRNLVQKLRTMAADGEAYLKSIEIREVVSVPREKRGRAK